MKIVPAKALAVDRIQVYVLCPFCGKVHAHGSNGEIDEINYGTRVPHCFSTDDNYEIIATPETIRKHEGRVKRKDIAKWLKKQMML